MDCIVLYCIVLRCVVLYYIALYGIVLLLYCIVSYGVVLYCIVLYCIQQYNHDCTLQHITTTLSTSSTQLILHNSTHHLIKQYTTIRFDTMQYMVSYHIMYYIIDVIFIYANNILIKLMFVWYCIVLYFIVLYCIVINTYTKGHGSVG